MSPFNPPYQAPKKVVIFDDTYTIVPPGVDSTAEAMSAFRMEPSAHNLAKTQAEADHLGSANAEQRAETRESWRTWFWGAVRMYLTAAAIVATFGTVGVICMLLGAANSEVVLETFSEVLR